MEKKFNGKIAQYKTFLYQSEVHSRSNFLNFFSKPNRSEEFSPKAKKIWESSQNEKTNSKQLAEIDFFAALRPILTINRKKLNLRQNRFVQNFFFSKRIPFWV